MSMREITVPKSFDDLRATIQHGPARPSRQPEMTTLVFQIGGDILANYGRTESGELMAAVLDDADLDLALPIRMSGRHLPISLN